MPLFFFDTDDGRTFIQDEEGCEASSPQVARNLALKAIVGIASDQPPLLNHCVYTVDVRDEAGKRVFHAKVEVAGEWLS